MCSTLLSALFCQRNQVSPKFVRAWNETIVSIALWDMQFNQRFSCLLREPGCYLVSSDNRLQVQVLHFLPCPGSFTKEFQAGLETGIVCKALNGDAPPQLRPAISLDQFFQDRFQRDPMQWIVRVFIRHKYLLRPGAQGAPGATGGPRRRFHSSWLPPGEALAATGSSARS